MKVLVTGGAGFIGSHVVDAYLAAGHEVLVVDNLVTGHRENVNPKARFVELDILDPKTAALVRSERPDVVNHHAAQMNVWKSVADPVFDARTNILGTIEILSAAHDVATGLEEAIRDELGPGVEVETHIEPMQPLDEPGNEAAPERVAAVREALKEIAGSSELVGEIHDVRVREADGGEIVNFHCVVDAGARVADVHEKVDELERALRLRFPSISRAIGHAEPAASPQVASGVASPEL